MKPVLILQHLGADGPAFLASWLQREGVPHEVHNAEAGAAFPDAVADYSALAILGGEMSANDPLPSLRQAERLLLQAMALQRPVLGHCLGGQLMARALGARVFELPAPEIGWLPLQVADGPAAAAWFGHPGPRRVFQWHFEAFDLPPGAERLAGSPACTNQAFAIGPHLAIQFHVEIDAEKLRRWSLDEGPRYRQALRRHGGSVHSGASMRADAGENLAAQQQLAARLYGRWLGAAVSD
jgi:GMP synthase (glutamine-hydrolysing)